MEQENEKIVAMLNKETNRLALVAAASSAFCLLFMAEYYFVIKELIAPSAPSESLNRLLKSWAELYCLFPAYLSVVEVSRINSVVDAQRRNEELPWQKRLGLIARAEHEITQKTDRKERWFFAMMVAFILVEQNYVGTLYCALITAIGKSLCWVQNRFIRSFWHKIEALQTDLIE